MAKNKKNVINEVVDKIMDEYGPYLYQADDADMFLRIRAFVKNVAKQEYDRGLVVAQVIKNESATGNEKTVQFQNVMDYNIEELASTLKKNKSEIREKTPGNWTKLKIKHEGFSEERAKSEDEELEEMMGFITSSSDVLEDSDEDSNLYQTQEDIFNDLLSKIIEPLTKQYVCSSLKDNDPTAQLTPDEPSKTTTMQGKREKLIHNVVETIIEAHKGDLSVTENFGREYLTNAVTEQFKQISNSIGLMKSDQNKSRKEWVDATNLKLHKNIDELTISLVDEMEKNAVAHENLSNRSENSNTDERHTLDLKQKALFLTDIVAPLAKIELLSQLKASNLSLHDITKEPTIIPRHAPPKPPIPTVYTENQVAAAKAVKIASTQVKRSENMKKPQR